VLRDGGVLVTTSSPDSTHLVGLRLRPRGIPWLADFRDPWVRRMSFAPPTRAHRSLHERLEGRVVRTADRITVTSGATREDFLRRYPELDPARIAVLPNGYDEEDFPAEAPPLAERFTLLHVGQLNPERPVGPLLDHLEAFLRSRPAARGRTQVDLVGPRYREDEEEAARRGLGVVVRFHDARPHREAVAMPLSAHLLVLLEQESDRGGLILPGKTFEYLRAGRPILGLVPRGAAWDLITGLRAGHCALPSDPEAGARVMAEAWDRFDAGAPVPPRPTVPGPEVAGFERRVLARRFAELLEETADAAAAR
jgi:glycosyltransferase involved in cell wall biosynthesis